MALARTSRWIGRQLSCSRVLYLRRKTNKSHENRFCGIWLEEVREGKMKMREMRTKKNKKKKEEEGAREGNRVENKGWILQKNTHTHTKVFTDGSILAKDPGKQKEMIQQR